MPQLGYKGEPEKSVIGKLFVKSGRLCKYIIIQARYIINMPYYFSVILCLTIGIVHLRAKVWLDKEARQAGCHVIVTISSSILM